MTQTPYPWENPQQDYKVTLAKRRSERRYRSLQLAKTLEILLTKFKKYNVNKFNSVLVSFSQQIFLLTKNLHHQYIQHCF